jgi:hypothetical protein
LVARRNRKIHGRSDDFDLPRVSRQQRRSKIYSVLIGELSAGQLNGGPW